MKETEEKQNVDILFMPLFLHSKYFPLRHIKIYLVIVTISHRLSNLELPLLKCQLLLLLVIQEILLFFHVLSHHSLVLLKYIL